MKVEKDGSFILTTQLGKCETELIIQSGGEEEEKAISLTVVNWHTPPDREEAVVELTAGQARELCQQIQKLLS